ncbi:MAG: hypothetical protein U1E40_17505 [Amaricoccus sp.]
MQIVNVSSRRMFVQHRAVPSAVDPDGASAMPVGAGRTLTVAGRPDGLPSMVWLYSATPGAGPAGRVPFWKGAVPPTAVIDADPASGRVTWNGGTFDAAHLARARAAVGDGSLDGVTLDALRAHAQGRDPAAPLAAPLAAPIAAAAADAPVQQFSDCELAIAGVVLDAVLLVFGVGSLIKTLNTPPVAAQVATAVGSAGLDAQRNGIAAMATTAPGGLAMAGKVFDIVQELGTTALPSVFQAAISNLGLLDKALYLGLMSAQVAAIVASGGSWAIPFIGIQLGLSGFLLGKSIANCYLTCNPGQQLPVIVPDAPEGSFIVGMGGRRLVPSSSPDNPRVLLGLDPGTYPAGADLWDIQVYMENATERVVRIRSLAYPDQYIVAPQATAGAQLTVETLDAAGGAQSPRAMWMTWWTPPTTPPTSGALPGYALQSLSTLGSSGPQLAMYGTNLNIPLQVFTPGPQSDANFLYLDTRKSDFDVSNEFRIGWRLELFASNNDWSFWNGTEQSSVALPAQEGTLTRPDDASYWSVVAMARSNGSDQGIAQVRCWSDASGRYVQACFNARGSWARYGLQDLEVSTASDETMGAILSAWIIPTDDGS